MLNMKGDHQEYERDGTVDGLDYFPAEMWEGDEESLPAKIDKHACNVLN